jgi:hypothetical protein
MCRVKSIFQSGVWQIRPRPERKKEQTKDDEHFRRIDAELRRAGCAGREQDPQAIWLLAALPR